MPARDLELLTQAALSAGDIAKTYFGAGPEVWDKGDGQGPVTEADLAIDRMLHSDLLQARPDYGWLSEETEDSTDRLNIPRVFIVDPIDGTRAFIAGKPQFAHSLAIADAGEIIAAVVHLPLLDLTYTASKDGGAFLNGKPITPSDQPNIDAARVLIKQPTLTPALWPGGVPDLTRGNVPSLAYRMCLTAAGEYDGMVTLRDTWEWDVAAGDLIAREAGAVVTDRWNAATRYNNPTPKLAGMVAAGPRLHKEFIQRL